MIKYLKIIFTLLTLLHAFSFSYAQLENLTFEVRAQNFILYDSITFTNPEVSGIYNIIQFDIYIQQTNIPLNDAGKMRFAIGQYHWNLNFGNGFTDTSGFNGYASVTYVSGSTTLSNVNALPLSPAFLAKNASDDNLPAGDGYPTGSLRSSVRMNSNTSLGNMSDVQISGTYPGTRVGTYRVKKKSGLFPSGTKHMRWRQGPLGINSNLPYSRMFVYNGLGGISSEVTDKGIYIMDTLSAFTRPDPALKLSMIPEGYYNSLSKRLNKKEDVTVRLRQPVTPYAVLYTAVAKIDSVNFTGHFIYPALSHGSYYISVSHKNCIDVWSSSPVSFTTDTTIYNFTTAQNKAYGNNQKQTDTSPVRFGLFSGNVNGDAIIDAADLSAIENDAEAGLSGNLITDVTGDKFVDAQDLSVTENNAYYSAIIIIP